MNYSAAPHPRNDDAKAAQRGQGLAEYGIILLIVAIALVAVISTLEPAVENLFE